MIGRAVFKARLSVQHESARNPRPLGRGGIADETFITDHHDELIGDKS